MMNRTRKTLLIAIPMLIAFSAIGMFVMMSDEQKTLHMALIDLSIDDLAKQSDVIVVGTVESAEESVIKRSEVFDHVFITYNVRISQELTGNYQDKTIPITTLGDERIYTSNSGADLKVGEKVLLFLTHTDQETVFGDAYVPIGGYQSKFLIDDENFAVNQKHGKIFLGDLISDIALMR